jgi:hypothetical protein
MKVGYIQSASMDASTQMELMRNIKKKKNKQINMNMMNPI